MDLQELYKLWDKARRCFVLEFPIQVSARDLEQITREALAYRGMVERMSKHPTIPDAHFVALPFALNPKQ